MVPLDCKASLVWKQTVEKRERGNPSHDNKKSTLVHKLDLAFYNSEACPASTNIKVLQMTGEILDDPKQVTFCLIYLVTVFLGCECALEGLLTCLF